MLYHLSPNGPRACRAKNGGCPYAAAGAPHYGSQEEAQAAYEKTMSETFGNFDTVKRTASEKVRQKAYKSVDRLKDGIRRVTASPQAKKVFAAVDSARQAPERAKETARSVKAKMVESSRRLNGKKDEVVRKMKDSASEAGERARTGYKALRGVYEYERARRAAAREEKRKEFEEYMRQREEQARLRREQRQEKLDAVARSAAKTYHDVESRAKSVASEFSSHVKSTAREIGNRVSLAADSYIVRQKRAESVRMGDVMLDGSKVIGSDPSSRSVYVVSPDMKSIRTISWDESPTISVKSRTPRQIANSVADSPIGRGVRRAGSSVRGLFRRATAKPQSNVMLPSVMHQSNPKRLVRVS